ncbi:MAG TPA: TonB-dependent receptor, partial [Rhizomicrobium sp.]|nr:TonB-dependent receptor [Rhizomicrobium sp.]
MRLSKLLLLSTAFVSASLAMAGVNPAMAADSHSSLVSPIAPMPLNRALEVFAKQTGLQVVYVSTTASGITTLGAPAGLTREQTLRALLTGTGLKSQFIDSNTVTISRPSAAATEPLQQFAQTSPAPRAVETVTVTSSKLGGADVQSIPIAITALSQEQLTSTQTAGGPDLIKQVPNMTFTKTNFSGYSIQLRGIGTQAISVTTDPAVAVAFNDMPFIRNHFFEQEFFDVAQVQVLRGPQGTLYGRNATAGVVNLTSAKPSDQFEAMASGEFGNYKQKRLEAMLNLPIVDDRLAMRFAGEWTKRDGYSFNALTDRPIDGRNLWSGRASVRFKPTEKLTADFVWEHFQEDDDRIRSSKQLCHRDLGPETIGGFSTAQGSDGQLREEFLSQGCKPASLYSPESFQVPNSLTLPYYGGLIGAGFGQSLASPMTSIPQKAQDAYAGVTQSMDLRSIESSLDPSYRAKNNVFQLNVDYAVTPSLNVISSTGYSNDFLWATQDYNRFNTRPGIFAYIPGTGSGQWGTLISSPDGNYACADGTLSIGGNNCTNPAQAVATGYFCDPQLGCSNRMVAQDLVEAKAWQLNQEFRLASNFSGPLNFSVGGNFMHYETIENYFVFFNTITMYNVKQVKTWDPSDPSKMQCERGTWNKTPVNPNDPGAAGYACGWTDTGSIDNLDYQGHNYFLSQNPYVLNSYAGFGEVYYNVLDDLKLTGGVRWTDDQKHFVGIPSALLAQGYGYVATNTVDQEWRAWTGRFAANWSPKVSFTDQTLIYGTFAHGYKAGGANPPGALFTIFQSGDVPSVAHPLTFEPEFINAYEFGTKNTMLDGALTLNGNLFYYDYKGYQISEIVDRTSINLNFDATVKGAELEAKWEPVPGLRFSFSGGYEQTRLNDGSKAIDLMDRTAGNPDWILVKPFVSQASNCVLPAYVVAYLLNPIVQSSYAIPQACGYAYANHNDPVTNRPYTANPTGNTIQGRPMPAGTYPGFDPLAGTAGHPYTGQNSWNGVDYGP